MAGLTPKNEFHRALKEYGSDWQTNWPPTHRIALGDVGVIENGRFVRRTSLANRGLTFKRLYGRKCGIKFTTERVVSITPDVGVRASDPHLGIVDVDAEVKVEFLAGGALLLHADGCREVSVDDQEGLFAQLQELAKVDKWKFEWWVVVEVVDSRRALILASREGNASAHVGFATSASVTDQINLARGHFDIKYIKGRKLDIEFFADSGAVLLYRLRGVSKSFFKRRPVVKVRRSGAPAKKAAAKKAPAKKAVPRRRRPRRPQPGRGRPRRRRPSGRPPKRPQPARPRPRRPLGHEEAVKEGLPGSPGGTRKAIRRPYGLWNETSAASGLICHIVVVRAQLGLG